MYRTQDSNDSRLKAFGHHSLDQSGNPIPSPSFRGIHGTNQKMLSLILHLDLDTTNQKALLLILIWHEAEMVFQWDNRPLIIVT